MATKNYRCKDCGKEVTVEARAAVPECCGEKMQQLPLDPCTHPNVAEAARPGVIDEACDDGVH
ncbi:MAG TPA: hypothetical protein VFL04_04205 [Rectinemataceae bacterium]|nr:hypothetical protein [Rectinemataceae bacterium]